MAVISTQDSQELADGFVLAPERYDPRRSVKATKDCRRLGELVEISRTTIKPTKDAEQLYLVLDTGNASEGFITGCKEPAGSIGSAKKPLQSGDVIISRLRPYLRQVGFVDDALQSATDLKIVCSTEFFVLRAADDQSIAYLVPFLLSDTVQVALAASQEGGHHPRFNESTLLSLPVPNSVFKKRKSTSRSVEAAAELLRKSETTMRAAILDAESAFASGP